MKIEKRLVLLITLSAIVSTMFLASLTSTARATPSAQLVIQPSFAYYANYTTLPAKLTFNISIVNVTAMATWQLSIRWNNSLLTYGLISIPSDNVFSPQSLIVVPPDLSIPGMLVYGANIPPGGNSFNGSGVIAQLQLNVTSTVTPPVSCAVELTDVPDGTFILDSQLASMPITPVNAAYAYNYAIGTTVTHSISGSTRPVTTSSNGTIQSDSGVIDTVGKTISFNVTGNMGDTAWLYADLPKNVINVTSDDITRWNVTVNGANIYPDITQNATDTSMFTFITFTESATVEVEGDNIIPELSSMLIILIIASSATVAVVKSRTRKN